MVWDSRIAARADPTTGEAFHSPVITVPDAHALNDKQKRRRTPLQGRTRPSVTSLSFLQDSGTQLATGGGLRVLSPPCFGNAVGAWLHLCNVYVLAV